MIGNISENDKKKIEDLIEKFEMEKNISPIRQSSMVCVALPTCPLALARSATLFARIGNEKLSFHFS